MVFLKLIFLIEKKFIIYFIGKQEEIKIKNSIDKLEEELGSGEEILNGEFSSIKVNNYREIEPRSHG